MTMKSLPLNKPKPYTKSVQRHPKLRIPKHGEVHRSLEFAFDPSDFVRNPSKIVGHGASGNDFYDLAGGGRAEVESDDG